MKIIAIYSNKGGVGKTATAVNLAYAVSRLGNRTLLCDLDSQGAAGYCFRIESKKKFSKKKLLKGQLLKFIRGTDYENLDLLPSNISFRHLDLALGQSTVPDKRLILQKVFAGLQGEYDVLVLDCPPTLTLLSENIFTAATSIVIPVVPTTLSILALRQLMTVFKKMGVGRKKIVPFFSMVEKKNKLHEKTVNNYKKYQVFLKTAIPYAAQVERMGLYRSPVAVTQPNSEIALLYMGLQLEIWKRSRES